MNKNWMFELIQVMADDLYWVWTDEFTSAVLGEVDRYLGGCRKRHCEGGVYCQGTTIITTEAF